MCTLTRNLAIFGERHYDLIVVGGGIFGAFAAREAALRGLTVALVEKNDFAHATSANHFKMVHGGIRYLQHGDIIRIKESSKERSAMLRIAPHLVSPLPIVIPTYGHGKKGKAFLAAGMLCYDLLTCGRNQKLLAGRQIPWSQFLSKEKITKLFPGIKEKGLTGGAVFADGQVYNPPRLALSVIKSAVEKGADVANYLEQVDFIINQGKIAGVIARDCLSGMKVTIRGDCVLNTAGPWAYRIIKTKLGLTLDSPPSFSRDFAFVIKRKPRNTFALACATSTGDTDTLMDRGGRHLFLVPWRNYILIGVWHSIFPGPPEEIIVTREDLQSYIDEINQAYPALNCSIEEVSAINTGLTLFGQEEKQKNDDMSFGKRSMFIDHGKEHNIEGLLTLIGVRATTARGMAQKALDIICKKLNKPKTGIRSDFIPIYGGDIKDLSNLEQDAIRKYGNSVNHASLQNLLRDHGSRFQDIVDYGQENAGWLQPITDSQVIKAEIIHAVRKEMATTLSDIVFRRTGLGTGASPGDASLEECAELVGKERGWDEETKKTELDQVKRHFPDFSKSSFFKLME